MKQRNRPCGSTKKRFIIAALLLCTLSVFGTSPENKDSIRFEVLLNEQMLAKDSMEIRFIPSVEVTSTQLIVLSSANRLYLLGWGGVASSEVPISDSISAFAYTPDGYLLMVNRKTLCFADTAGRLKTVQELPTDNMRIATGESAMYLFDREKNREKYPLYRLAQGGAMGEIFEIPTPIDAVTEFNKTIFFSSGSALFAFDSKSKSLEAIAAIETGEPIIAIAINPKSYTIYFATPNAIYALKENGIILITDKFGGILKFFGNGLLVFDAEKKFLMRIVGLEN